MINDGVKRDAAVQLAFPSLDIVCFFLLPFFLNDSCLMQSRGRAGHKLGSPLQTHKQSISDFTSANVEQLGSLREKKL